MKKLNFTFKDGNEVLYDLDVPYQESGGNILFEIDDSKFEFGTDEVYFLKEDETSVLEIREVGRAVKCFYTVKDGDLNLEVEVLKFEVKNEDGIYSMKYVLESDENREKSIILKKE